MTRYAVKAVFVLFFMSIPPAILHVPDPERMFYFGIGIAVALGFLIYGFAEMLTAPFEFHAHRLWSHMLVLVWLGIFTYLFKGMLEGPWLRALYLLVAMGAIPSIVSIGFHIYYPMREHRNKKRQQPAVPAKAI